MSFCSVGERPSKTTVCLAVSAVDTANRSIAICTCLADATGLNSIFAKLWTKKERKRSDKDETKEEDEKMTEEREKRETEKQKEIQRLIDSHYTRQDTFLLSSS